MKHNDPNKAVRNRRSNKKRNNNSTKVRDLVNAVRRNAQGKMKRMCNRFVYSSRERKCFTCYPKILVLKKLVIPYFIILNLFDITFTIIYMF